MADLTLDPMQHGIHQGETVGILYKFNSGKGLAALELLLFRGKIKIVIMYFPKILVGDNHKTESPAGRVPTVLPQCGLHKLHYGADKGSRGKILTGAGFLFVGVFCKSPS